MEHRNQNSPFSFVASLQRTHYEHELAEQVLAGGGMGWPITLGVAIETKELNVKRGTRSEVV